MKVGVVVPMTGGAACGPFLREFAVRAEELGFDSLWVWERLLRAVDPRTPYGGASSSYAATTVIPDQQKNVMAPTEVMAALAAWTNRVRIGSSVLVVGLTNPVALAKRLATIDILSGGRLIAGLGLGWSEDEYLAAGVDFQNRGARSEEFIELLIKCWSDDPVAHSGRFFQVPNAFVRPKPLQQPRPPLIFGLWSKAGLARTARLADGWTSGGGMTLSDVVAARAWMNSLRGSGQPPLTVHKRIFVQLPVPSRADLSTAEVVEEVAKDCAAGIDEVILDSTYSHWSVDSAGWLGFLESMVPALQVARA